MSGYTLRVDGVEHLCPDADQGWFTREEAAEHGREFHAGEAWSVVPFGKDEDAARDEIGRREDWRGLARMLGGRETCERCAGGEHYKCETCEPVRTPKFCACVVAS